MANERYGLMCPICKDACYMGKTMGDGIYSNRGTGLYKDDDNDGHRMRIIWTWMWKHLTECHKQFEWGNSDKALFTVVSEGHSSLHFSGDRHWNRHTDEDYLKG